MWTKNIRRTELESKRKNGRDWTTVSVFFKEEKNI